MKSLNIFLVLGWFFWLGVPHLFLHLILNLNKCQQVRKLSWNPCCCLICDKHTGIIYEFKLQCSMFKQNACTPRWNMKDVCRKPNFKRSFLENCKQYHKLNSYSTVLYPPAANTKIMLFEMQFFSAETTF